MNDYYQTINISIRKLYRVFAVLRTILDELQSIHSSFDCKNEIGLIFIRYPNSLN